MKSIRNLILLLLVISFLVPVNTMALSMSVSDIAQLTITQQAEAQAGGEVKAEAQVNLKVNIKIPKIYINVIFDQPGFPSRTIEMITQGSYAIMPNLAIGIGIGYAYEVSKEYVSADDGVVEKVTSGGILSILPFARFIVPLGKVVSSFFEFDLGLQSLSVKIEEGGATRSEWSGSDLRYQVHAGLMLHPINSKIGIMFKIGYDFVNNVEGDAKTYIATMTFTQKNYVSDLAGLLLGVGVGIKL